ncbi:MAG: YraN family protein [Clostridiales bacterium]|nr:YraN family protein [Clostridiales bacterium]
MNKRTIGDFGERAARKYLEYKGYEIEECNFSLKCGEIDIIARDNETLVFAEVKTRKSSEYGAAAEFVDAGKQERLRRTALMYAGANADMRFDVIEVYYKILDNRAELTKINHIKNAF